MNYYDQHIIRCLEKIERGRRNSASRNEEQLAKPVQREPNNSQHNLTRTLSPSYGRFESRNRNHSLYLSNDDPTSEYATNNGQQPENFLVYCKRCHPYQKNNACDTHRHAIIFNPTYEDKTMLRKSFDASPSEHTCLPCRCNLEEKGLFSPNQNVPGNRNICCHCEAQARYSGRRSEYCDFELGYPTKQENGYCECEMPFGSTRQEGEYCTCNKRVSENNTYFDTDGRVIQIAGEKKFCECKKQTYQVTQERNYLDWTKPCDVHDCTRKSQYGFNEGKYCNCPRAVQQSPEGKKCCECDKTRFNDRNKPEPQKPYVSDYYHSVAVQYSYPMIHQSQLPTYKTNNFTSIDEANPLIPLFLTRESINEAQSSSNPKGNHAEPLKLTNYNSPVELSHFYPRIRSGDLITLKGSNHTVGEKYSLPQATLKKPIVVLAVPDSKQAQADKPYHNSKENEIPLLPDVLKIPINLNKNTCQNCLKHGKIKIVENPRKPTEKEKERHSHHKKKHRHSSERHRRKTELPKYDTRGVLHFVDRVPDDI